jgi:hypothetical protein
MKKRIEQIILETQNDIYEYLGSEVPLEYQQHDIDEKLEKMKKDIIKILDEDNEDIALGW